jgi:hypothetical protein
VAVVDLVTPWWHASESAEHEAAFRARHAPLFEVLRRQRAAALNHIATPPDLDRHAARAADSATALTLEAILAHHAAAGWRVPDRVVLLAGTEAGPAAEVLPEPDQRSVALYLDRAPGETVEAALIEAIATYHRWTDPAGTNPIARIAAQGDWDRWDAARRVPLAEWVYGAGIAVHALAAARPDWSAERLIGISRGGMARLRQRERELRRGLDADLDQAGVGLVLRWLDDHAPPALRRGADGHPLPLGVGRYLGWRMLAQRVARVGALAAAGMSSGG